MLIIIDARIPDEAIGNLRIVGEVFLLKSDKIVYDSIQGHPDVFMMQLEDLVIVAPNAPKDLFKTLQEHRIPFLKGKTKLNDTFPQTVYYNAVSTSDYIIHKKNYTDSCIIRQTDKKQFIEINQAYTRCNLIPLSNSCYITSDKSIEKTLLNQNLEVHYFTPETILLPGQKNGFIGGTMGLWQNKMFVIGKLNHYQEGEKLTELLNRKKIKIIELYNGPLIDGGGIFFLE